MQDRVILHCDCNSFFASVETVLNPSYRDVPMAVCGSEADRHGIVLAKNELAKKYGVVTAETVASAKRKCPALVIAAPHYGEYVKFSKRVNEIYARYTDIIEPFGIDESWLDVTASQKIFGSGLEIAEEIRSAVKKETGLTVSIGVSFNKPFAKLGSDYKKPDAITVIDRSNFKEIAYPLHVSSLLFVGKKTEKALSALGVRTIGALSEISRATLNQRLGKLGDLLYSYANGLDESPVEPEVKDAQSISNGLTFRHDLLTRAECKLGIEYLSEELGAKLRNSGMKCGTVCLTVKDESFHTIQRRRKQSPISDISREIADTAYSILLDEWEEGRAVRMLTVSVSNLTKEAAVQLDMFDAKEDNQREKILKRENAVDKIRQKYGGEAIISGAIIDSDIGIYKLKHKDEGEKR